MKNTLERGVGSRGPDRAVFPWQQEMALASPLVERWPPGLPTAPPKIHTCRLDLRPDLPEAVEAIHVSGRLAVPRMKKMGREGGETGK